MEVAFVQQPASDEKWPNSLFLVNRFIDSVFIVDMLLQFRLAYREEDVHGTRWITTPRQIVRHYACSFWFPLDLFSVLTSVFDIVDVEGAGDLTALRAVRTLRLIKLVKLARGSRIFKRWAQRMSFHCTDRGLSPMTSVTPSYYIGIPLHRLRLHISVPFTPSTATAPP